MLAKFRKHYFVFTDSTKISPTEFIHVFHQEKQVWPLPTLLRYKIFNSQYDTLRSFDFVFFANANLLFVDQVGEEILPVNHGLCVVLHPGFYAEPDNCNFTYERNSASTAFIPYGNGEHYFMGGFNGGTGVEFMEMSRSLEKNIDDDTLHGLTAVWHDESHLNRYMLDRAPLILNPSYGYPEGSSLPFQPRIIIRDKTKYGGHEDLRGIEIAVTKRSVIHRAISKVTSLVRFVLGKYCEKI